VCPGFRYVFALTHEKWDVSAHVISGAAAGASGAAAGAATAGAGAGASAAAASGGSGGADGAGRDGASGGGGGGGGGGNANIRSRQAINNSKYRVYLVRKSVLAGLQARGRRNSDASRKDCTSYRTSSPTQPYASPSTRGWPQRTWPRRKDGGGDGAAEPPQPRVAHEVRGPPRRAAA